MEHTEDATEDKLESDKLDDVNGELLPDRELQSLIAPGDGFGFGEVVYEPPGGHPDET